MKAANSLSAQEVNASNVYARWEEGKGELMMISKRFPVEPIAMKRYPEKSEVPNPPEDETAMAQSVGLKPPESIKEPSGGDTEAELQAEVEAVLAEKQAEMVP